MVPLIVTLRMRTVLEVSTKTLFPFRKGEEPVPENQVGEEIPGAPVSGT